MGINDELRSKLNQLVGTWRSDGVIVGGGQSEGETWHGFDIYEWFPGEAQLVHRVDVEIFGSRSESIEFFTPSLDPHSFDQTTFAGDGTVEHGSGSFDEQGRYLNNADGARAVLTFHTPESMSATWELRGEDGSWVPWMDVRFTRLGEPHIEIRSKQDHTV